MAIIPQGGCNGDRDEQTGLCNVVKRYVVDTVAEALTCGKGEGPLGLIEKRRPWVPYQNHPSKLLVAVTYEGTVDEDGGPGEDEDKGRMELDVVLEDQPLEGHARVDELIAQFNGKVDPATGRVTFPLAAPTTGSGSGSGAVKKKTGKSSKNPLFGLTSYVKLGSIFRRTRIVRTVPQDLLDRVGTFVQKLPRGLPTPKGMVWLVMPPRLVTLGNGFELAEEMKAVRDEPGFRVVYSMLHSDA